MATPIAALMLQRCAQAMEKVIVPNLTDDFAIETATWIGSLLLSLTPYVAEKKQELSEQNERMREILQTVLEVLHGEEVLTESAVRHSLIDRLDEELKKVTTGSPDVKKENDSLRAALVETIYGLDALTEDMPAELMSSLRQQIRSVLRQQLEHGLV